MLKGSCLCGGIRIEIIGKFSKIGMCHCSLCRRSSGSSATAVIIIDFAHLKWISGKDLVSTFQRRSGYGTAFCRVCGCPAPDTDAKKTTYSVPAGFLDDALNLQVGDHIFVGSKAHWDVIGDDAPQYDEFGPVRARDQG